MKKIKFYLGYVFYFFITVEQRRNYLRAQEYGIDCHKSHAEGVCTRVFYFDETKPPKRHYVTYQQYKRMYYPNARRE